MRHNVNSEGFEVLSAFKSNHSMGRAMPELMKGCAMGMTAVGAGRLSKRVEKRKLLFRKAAQSMDKKQPIVQFLGHGSVNLMHDARVESAHIS